MSDQTQHPDVQAIYHKLQAVLHCAREYGSAVEPYTRPGEALFTSRAPDRHGVRITIALFPDADGNYAIAPEPPKANPKPDTRHRGGVLLPCADDVRAAFGIPAGQLSDREVLSMYQHRMLVLPAGTTITQGDPPQESNP